MWDFVIKANPNDNGLIQVTDNNVAEGLLKAKAQGLKVYQLKSNNVKSIITNVSINSKLPDAIKNAAFAAMSATEPEATTNEDNVLFRMYGTGVEDRFTQYAKKAFTAANEEADEELAEKKKKAQKKIDKYEKRIAKTVTGMLPWDDMKDYWNQKAIVDENFSISPDEKYKMYAYSYWYSITTGKSADRRTCADNQKDYLKDIIITGKDQGLQTAMLPIDLTFDILGLSGFWMGNAITLASMSDGGLLPDRYAGQTLFQVSKVNHKIDRSTWKTSVECMMRQTNESIPKKSNRVINIDTKEAQSSAYNQPGDYEPPKPKGEAEDYLNYDSLKATYEKLGYTFRENGQVNSAGIRIANLARSGVGSSKGNAGWIDWFCMAYKDESGKKVFETYPCTTVPGTSELKKVNKGHSSGAWAILKPGFYTSHIHAWHPRSEPNYRGGSQQIGNVSVYRDGNRDLVHDLSSTSLMTGYFGINIHRSHATGKAWRVGNYSWGCQVFLSNASYQRWLAQLHRNPKHAKKTQYEVIEYALIDEGDMEIKV
jgi:hypothetical protein